MTLIEIARIYTDLVQVDDQIPESEHNAKEEVGALRTKYHQMLMDKLTEEHIQFADRFEAMHLAFEIVKTGVLSRTLRSTLNEPPPSDYKGKQRGDK